MIRESRPLEDVGGDLWDEIRRLVRTEIELARTEVGQHVRLAAAAAIAALVAAVTATVAFLLIVLAAADGVAALLGWPQWGGLLVVALALGALTALAVGVAINRWSRVSVVPEQTAASLVTTAEWLGALPRRIFGR